MLELAFSNYIFLGSGVYARSKEPISYFQSKDIFREV